jgi:hypothetical protein
VHDFDLAAFCRLLVVDAPDAIIYADAEGIVRYWNRGAERLFGFSSDEVLGESLDLIIPGTFESDIGTGTHVQCRQAGHDTATAMFLPFPHCARMAVVSRSSSPFFPFGMTTEKCVESPQSCAM